jgi:hypothetical protein
MNTKNERSFSVPSVVSVVQYFYKNLERPKYHKMGDQKENCQAVCAKRRVL